MLFLSSVSILHVNFCLKFPGELLMFLKNTVWITTTTTLFALININPSEHTHCTVTLEYMDLNNRARQNLDKLEDKPEKVWWLLLAEFIEQLLEDEDGSSGAEDDERLTAKKAKDCAGQGCTQETLHYSLGKRNRDREKAWERFGSRTNQRHCTE